MRYISIVLIFLLVGAFHGKAQTVSTQTITYEESDTLFPNPERGFSAYRNSKITLSFIEALRNDNITVIQRIYTIPQFVNSPFTQDYLDLIESDFNTARQGGAKLVLRFSYTNDQNGDDAPLEIIFAQLDQLAPLFQKHYDVIAYVEAGFIGAWGEWYYSSNGLNNTTARRAVLFKELSVLPVERDVVVRTPGYKKAIFNFSDPLTPDSAFSGSFRARTGAHNDCFLSNRTDMGTYSSVEADKTYLNLDNRYVPQGGETCGASTYSVCSNSLIDMARMHWSVLNKDYHPDVINGWITNGCMDEIKRRLGYRLSLLQASLQDSVPPGGVFNLSFQIKNSGFASPYNPRNLEVILQNIETGDKYFLILNEDPRFWMAGDTVRVRVKAGIPADIPGGGYQTFLHLADPEPSIHNRPEYAIRLANADVWVDSTGYNSLLHTLTIDTNAPGEIYSGDSLFRPIVDHPTGLNSGQTTPPQFFSLEGSYPNPFNGSTVIRFSLNKTARVRLDIISVNGELVERFDEKTFQAGSHKIRWEPENLSSGSYFYRLTVNGISQVGKTLYIK